MDLVYGSIEDLGPGGGVMVDTATERRIGGWVTMSSQPTTRLALAAVCSLGVSVGVLATAATDQSQLGAPAFWPWILTALQVVALWAAGRSFWWGWLLGGSVQMPWIAYAIVTKQIGFLPGCVVSALVQVNSFIVSGREPRPGLEEAAHRLPTMTVRRVEAAF